MPPLKPALTIRLLEKNSLSRLEVREKEGVWKRVRLTRDGLRVDGKKVQAAFFGKGGGFHLRAPGLDRFYTGTLAVSPAPERPKRTLELLNRVPWDEYVASVTSVESSFDRSPTRPDYLKALATVVRGYARNRSAEGSHSPYDLCDSAHCQIYQGVPKNTDLWLTMARPGSSWVASHGKIGYFFNRCCGGTLETADVVWAGKNEPPPLLDEWHGKPLCKNHPSFRWTRTISFSEALFYIGVPARKGVKLESFDLVRASNGGTVRDFTARVRYPDRSTRLIPFPAGDFIARAAKELGWSFFTSGKFRTSVQGSKLVIKGRGFGHGVGFCQAGAKQLARLGFSWKAILDFYFGRRQ